jgi:hypothetical protein
VVCNIVSESRVGTLTVCEPVGKNALKRPSSQGGKGKCRRKEAGQTVWRHILEDGNFDYSLL